ncbi:uncharacterized protein BT62DRAFT_362849 [Guyanagaster necrorhizus]|nr:uncharacterized protein BT62DRAFT_362849 [Guyanagaster necrorhizus MCA 3950]KAG7442896.1 hypothetical protein BT62DRAFT_362849 [Guyanagaster necrorhizus MCA 3950]
MGSGNDYAMRIHHLISHCEKNICNNCTVAYISWNVCRPPRFSNSSPSPFTTAKMREKWKKKRSRRLRRKRRKMRARSK